MESTVFMRMRCGYKKSYNIVPTTHRQFAKKIYPAVRVGDLKFSGIKHGRIQSPGNFPVCVIPTYFITAEALIVCEL